jgi:hypothetical protein
LAFYVIDQTSKLVGFFGLRFSMFPEVLGASFEVFHSLLHPPQLFDNSLNLSLGGHFLHDFLRALGLRAHRKRQICVTSVWVL